MKTTTQSKDVTIEFEGRQINGSYTERDGMVIVSTGVGRKATQRGSLTAEGLAQMMLRELAQEGKA